MPLHLPIPHGFSMKRLKQRLKQRWGAHAEPGPMVSWLWLSVVVVVLDQATKALAETFLVMHQPVPVLPFFNLTLMYNTGAAFSILADAGGWQRWFFVLLTTVIVIVLYRWLRALPATEKTTAIALTLVLGGAVGNLIDRLAAGRVVDFIDVYWGIHHWPAFNIADSAITLGVLLLVYLSFFPSKPSSPSP